MTIKKLYEVVRKICLETNIEWNDNAKYATINNIELKEYLSKNKLFE